MLSQILWWRDYGLNSRLWPIKVGNGYLVAREFIVNIWNTGGEELEWTTFAISEVNECVTWKSVFHGEGPSAVWRRMTLNRCRQRYEYNQSCQYWNDWITMVEWKWNGKPTSMCKNPKERKHNVHYSVASWKTTMPRKLYARHIYLLSDDLSTFSDLLVNRDKLMSCIAHFPTLGVLKPPFAASCTDTSFPALHDWIVPANSTIATTVFIRHWSMTLLCDSLRHLKWGLVLSKCINLQ